MVEDEPMTPIRAAFLAAVLSSAVAAAPASPALAQIAESELDPAVGDQTALAEPIEPSDPVADAERSREEELAAASDYLNALDTMQGRFLQIDHRGVTDTGLFFLSRPGKVRFEYDPPHPSLIVSDGRTVAHEDRDLETIDRIPLRDTPLNMFLRDDVDLSADAEIGRVWREEGLLLIEAADRDGRVEGEITLVFSTPALELRAWAVRDALGQETRVMLNEIVRGGEIDPDLFEIEAQRPRRRGG